MSDFFLDYKSHDLKNKSSNFVFMHMSFFCVIDYIDHQCHVKTQEILMKKSKEKLN